MATSTPRMKPRKRRSKATTTRAALAGKRAPVGMAAQDDGQDVLAGGRTPLEMFVHAIGNSIGAAALQVEILAGTGLSPTQRDRAQAALAELRGTLDKLDALRGWRDRKPTRSD